MSFLATPEQDHLPDPVSYICLICDQPWPCEPAKATLFEHYGHGSPSLSMYLAAQLADAAQVLSASSEELYRRFLGWARSPGAI